MTNKPSDMRRDRDAGGSAAIDSIREMIRGELRRAAETLTDQGAANPALDGKLLRPLLAYLVVPPGRRGSVDQRFWSGALAIEMAHEASLLHDDVVDEAKQRRGKPTVFSEAGVGTALVLGDHLLTSSYRAAAATASPAFLSTFIEGVDRTVAGELAQGRSRGSVLNRPEYEGIITGKSGEFFRCALSLGVSLVGDGDVTAAGRLGARIGRLYQMIDDFLDYCPSIDRGKPPLQDWRQRKWTWPLGLIDEWSFELGEIDLLDRLYTDTPNRPSAMGRGVAWIRQEAEDLLRALGSEGLETRELTDLVEAWAELVDRAYEAEMAGRPAKADTSEDPTAPSHRRDLPFPAKGVVSSASEMAEDLGTPAARQAYFGRHARSFRFASRLFPAADLDRVSEVYAFCRFTDDLVDEAPDSAPDQVRARLEDWRALAREAYRGETTGVAVLDAAMGTMRENEVPFHYADDLISGVGMDIEPRAFPDMNALRVYSYRVAGTVGGWLTELFGRRDPWILDRAFALGHAMQLTNILRDVGEDLERGRIYLPEDRMTIHGIDGRVLHSARESGRPLPRGYHALMEDLMREADRDYARAWEAMPSLPRAFRGPVAIAAAVYRGIHDEIRKNQFDNLTRRAATGRTRKVALASGAMWRLLRMPPATKAASAHEEVRAPGPEEAGSEAAA